MTQHLTTSGWRVAAEEQRSPHQHDHWESLGYEGGEEEGSTTAYLCSSSRQYARTASGEVGVASGDMNVGRASNAR